MVVLMLSYSIRVMDPNSSLGKFCLGENVVEISSDKVEGSRDWNYPKFQDTANSGGKKEMKAMVFHQMDTEEVSDRFMAPCFVNGLEAYDGEINLGVEENMISNEYAVKLCLEHEVKRGNKVVKKELIVALRGEIYFVKFIINPEEDDVEPGVILGRTFLRMTKEITDFGAGTVIIYPEFDPFLEDIEEEEKCMDDWDHLLDFNLDDVPLLDGEELSPFVCKMGKSSRNKKRSMENMSLFYQDIGTSSSAGGHLTQEEAAKEALAIKISQKFALLEEVRPVIETMAYNDKYKKILNEIQKDKVGVTTLISKFLILDIPIDRNAPIVVGQGFLHTIGGLVNTLERLFFTFDGFFHQTFRDARSDVMRNAESDSDDEEEYQIKRNNFRAPIYGPEPAPYLNCNDPAERSLAIQTHVNGMLDYKGSYTKEEEATGQWCTEIRLTDPLCEHTMMRLDHQDPKALDNMKPWKWYCSHKFIMSSCYGKDATEMRSLEIDDMLRIRLREAESNEEIFTFVAWIRAFNINEPIYAELYNEFYSTYEFDEVCADDELETKKIIKFRLGRCAHNLTLLEFAHKLGLYHADELEEDGFNVYFEGGLRSDERFNAQEYWYANVAWLIARWMKRKGASTQKESQICCGQFISKIARKSRVLTDDVVRSLSALIYCRDLDTTPLRDLIDSEGKLILEDPQPGVPRVGILRPPRASTQDL
ncbi:hypothetical protein Tco_0976852 [Tanacetum coccineum]|uniref:Uncharacterized protein n=1 Tax=Tanacetum coccineum TaxID=301880 RepID=A0ABQ5EIF3_9ASTR